MDLTAIADAPEAAGASLRKHAEREALAGQQTLPLDDGWHEWAGGDEPPAEARDKVVDIETRNGTFFNGPAGTWNWRHEAEPLHGGDITRWRIAAEQPATP